VRLRGEATTAIARKTTPPAVVGLSPNPMDAGSRERSLPHGHQCAHTEHMSAARDTDIDLHEDGSVRCWCCGTIEVPDRMVHLGDHPEVHLCLGCAHFVHRRAREIEDARKEGPAAFVRDRVRSLRALVIRRGWHHNRFTGATLRRLDRYLP